MASNGRERVRTRAVTKWRPITGENEIQLSEQDEEDQENNDHPEEVQVEEDHVEDDQLEEDRLAEIVRQRETQSGADLAHPQGTHLGHPLSQSLLGDGHSVVEVYRIRHLHTIFLIARSRESHHGLSGRHITVPRSIAFPPGSAVAGSRNCKSAHCATDFVAHPRSPPAIAESARWWQNVALVGQ